MILYMRRGRAEVGTPAIRTARIIAVPVMRRRMPRYFGRAEELMDADDVEVQGEEGEEAEGAVVRPAVLGRPVFGDEQDDEEEILELVRRLSLGRGVLSCDQFRYLLETARRRVQEDSVPLQPLAAGRGDDGRGGTTVAVAAPAADDDDDDGRARGRSVLLYYTLRGRYDEEEGGRRRGHGGGGRDGGGGRGPCDEDDPDLGPGSDPLRPTMGDGDGEEEEGGCRRGHGSGGPRDEVDPEPRPGSERRWATTGHDDGEEEEEDAVAATMARVMLCVGFLAAVLVCVHHRDE